MSDNNKNYEIIILSDCSKEYKVVLELYKEYTKDEYFNKKKERISDKNNKFKIHFFDIQDRYWPAISNICKHCDGAMFAVDLDKYTAESGEEFVNEWLVNLDDLDKNEMAMIIIGVTKSIDNYKFEEGWNKLNDIGNDKKIEKRKIDLKNEKALKDAFSSLFNQISKDCTDNNIKKEDDDDIEEILDNYKMF